MRLTRSNRRTWSNSLGNLFYSTSHQSCRDAGPHTVFTMFGQRLAVVKLSDGHGIVDMDEDKRMSPVSSQRVLKLMRDGEHEVEANDNKIDYVSRPTVYSVLA